MQTALTCLRRITHGLGSRDDLKCTSQYTFANDNAASPKQSDSGFRTVERSMSLISAITVSWY